MEAELLQSLEDIGYAGPLLDAPKFSQALQGGARSPDFTNLVSWLTDQIGAFEKLDDTVHPTSCPEDANSFLLELSTFLKELGCVNTKLTAGNANQRLATLEDRGALIEYLIVELMTSKMLEARKPDTNNTTEITISESITAKNMREMLTALRFQKPPDNISPELLFKKLHTKVSEVLKQVPKDLIGTPLFFGELSNNQWESLDKLQGDLNEEYTVRRETFLKRLDVTINSFSWSERIRPKVDELNKVYHSKRDAMQRDPDVTLAHLLSARDDLAIIEKTSSASVRKNTRSAVNKVMIGAVPDRGGRAHEQEPPPPEMPPWQKDKVPGPQRGGFSGGRGGGGNDRGGGRGGGRGGRGGGGQGGGGGYRDNKSANTNFGQNYDNQPKQFFGDMNLSFGNQFQNKSTSSQSSGYSSNQYSNKGGNYGGNPNSGGYGGQSTGYSGNQSSGYSGNNHNLHYGNQTSSGYQNQGSGGYNNQGGGYDRRSGGGDYNRGGQGRGGRVQGGWNQGNDGYNKGGYNNRSGGQGGQRY